MLNLVEAMTAQDGPEIAKMAHLRYVTDSSPGLRRVAAGKGFKYINAHGKTIKDDDTLRRIKRLAIPPAWKNVWICPVENGHLQATGTDNRGRKQYRYHPRWREVRDETKYNKMLAFAKVLPRIRKRVAKDLRAPELSKRQVLATVVRLLEASLIRVGNEEYAEENHSYGLTTLKNHHAKVRKSSIQFHFRGKSGKVHQVEVHDKRLAQIVRECQDIPGQELFQYIDAEGNHQPVHSEDVNDYLREISDGDFTAKDFRTWAGTVLAGIALQEFQKFDSKAQAKKNLVQAIESVAARLGNTPAICKKCYIHPEILDGYMQGATIQTIRARAENELKKKLHQLSSEEAAVVAFLQRRLAQKEQPLEKMLKQSLKRYKRPQTQRAGIKTTRRQTAVKSSA
ncbi:MAG TPA: DNA topoisomerase IB [Verrucomicrobiae bacterium]|nr:DNA topoisomerase IB [Verrucomicrobiae bacterium]